MDDPSSIACGYAISTRVFAPHGVFVEIAGEADLASIPDLRAAIAREIVQGHRHIVVDLSSATLIDCACLGAVLREVAPLRAEPDATLVMAGASGLVQRLLALLDFGRVCEILPDADAAAELAVDPSRTRAEGWRELRREEGR